MADALGIGHGTIYGYFADIHELFVAIIDEEPPHPFLELLRLVPAKAEPRMAVSLCQRIGQIKWRASARRMVREYERVYRRAAASWSPAPSVEEAGYAG